MGFLTTEERAAHYSMRLMAVKNDISSVRRDLRKAMDSIDDGWTGQVAQACRDKLESVRNELKNASDELREAEKKMSKINSI